MARKMIAPDRLDPEKGITIGNDQRKALEDEGRFPKRVPVTARTYAYVEDEIDAWLEARVAERDAGKLIASKRRLARHAQKITAPAS